MIFWPATPFANFYPRPPRGGRRVCRAPSRRGVGHFYPRPPRGGRRDTLNNEEAQGYFYPRPPRGGRHGRHAAGGSEAPISIHALREEGDSSAGRPAVRLKRFLSTPSARRATRHALTADPVPDYFYPRPPRGGRQSPAPSADARQKFLSTPSARRATSRFCRPCI